MLYIDLNCDHCYKSHYMNMKWLMFNLTNEIWEKGWLDLIAHTHPYYHSSPFVPVWQASYLPKPLAFNQTGTAIFYAKLFRSLVFRDGVLNIPPPGHPCTQTHPIYNPYKPPSDVISVYIFFRFIISRQGVGGKFSGTVRFSGK